MQVVSFWDGVSDELPFVAEDHRRAAPGERQVVLAYLWAGETVLEVHEPLPDYLRDPNPPVVPGSCLTDGFWLWSAAVAYYLERYALLPENAFLDDIAARDHEPPVVPQVRVAAAARELQHREREQGLHTW